MYLEEIWKESKNEKKLFRILKKLKIRLFQSSCLSVKNLL